MNYGKILVAGTVLWTNFESGFVFAGFLSDGPPDSSNLFTQEV